MKKLLLLALSTGLFSSAFAQVSVKVGMDNHPNHIVTKSFNQTSVAAKTTAVGDTFIYGHIGTADNITNYYVGDTVRDSGWVAGMNPYGAKGFAERFSAKGTDSTIQVLGLFAMFGGTVSPSSTNTVNFKVWKEGAKTVWSRPTIFNSGLPDSVLATQTVNVTNLRIHTVPGTPDTEKLVLFTTPTYYLTKNFFVGYDMAYTWGSTAGDTIGLKSNKDGQRTEAMTTTLTTSDTTFNNINVTQLSSGTWVDNAAGYFTLFYNYYIFPIVKIGMRTNVGTSSISRNGFEFFGNYPNPAVSNTNIKFSIANGTGVKVVLMDMNGKVINTIEHAHMAAGEHTISLNVANLAAGQYIYSIRTADGNGIASVLEVIK